MYCKPWGHLKRAEKSLASICLESTDDGKHLREQNWKLDSLLSYWWTTTPFLSQLNPTVYRRVLLQGGNCCGWIRFLLVFLSIHWFSQEYRPKQTNKQADKGEKSLWNKSDFRNCMMSSQKVKFQAPLHASSHCEPWLLQTKTQGSLHFPPEH